jgi:hypothetical protein
MVVCPVHVSNPHLSVMQSQTAKADVLEQPGTVQFLKLKMGRLRWGGSWR